MASQPVPEALSDFKRLNNSTYIYDPPTTTNTTHQATSAPPPDLILLPAWLDAAPRHIAKYTHGYQTLYPTTKIILITTSLYNVTLSTRYSEALRLAPALALLASLPPDTGILLHSFSNGGAYTAHLLARLYKARTGHVLPIRGQLLDSAPGEGHYGRTAMALAQSLPSRSLVLRLVSLVLLHCFLGAYYVLKRATGGANKVEVMRDGLLDPRYWDPRVPRGYVFSKVDGMVVWRDVVDHAVASREKGWETVWTEEFVGSAHCGHLVVDEERYWGIVERVWKEGLGE